MREGWRNGDTLKTGMRIVSVMGMLQVDQKVFVNNTESFPKENTSGPNNILQ